MSDLVHEGRWVVEADLLEKASRKCKHQSIPCSNKVSRNLRPSREVGREHKIPSQKTTRKTLKTQIKRNNLMRLVIGTDTWFPVRRMLRRVTVRRCVICVRGRMIGSRKAAKKNEGRKIEGWNRVAGFHKSEPRRIAVCKSQA